MDRASRPATTSEIAEYAMLLEDVHGFDIDRTTPIVAATLRVLDGVFLPAPDLLEAGRYLTADGALELFEHSDLGELGRHESFVRYIGDTHTPLYSLSGLGQILARFHAYLDADQESLIATGFRGKSTSTRFSQSDWLDLLLGNLYWIEPPEFPLLLTVGELGLTFSDKKHIENDRQRMLGLKKDLTRELASAIDCGKSDGLFDACLNRIASVFSAEEVKYYAGIDEQYPLTAHPEMAIHVGLGAGGISDMLQLVGHVLAELTIGTMDKTYAALRRGCLLDDEDFLIHESYYCFVDQGQQAVIDNLCTEFLDLFSKQRSVWKDYRTRVGAELDNNFRVPLELGLLVDRRFRESLEQYLLKHSNIALAHLENDGRVPNTVFTQTVGDGRERGNEFKRKGDMWYLFFDGYEVQKKDMLGFRYIACLIVESGKEIGVHRIEELAHGRVAGEDPGPGHPIDEDDVLGSVDAPSWQPMTEMTKPQLDAAKRQLQSNLAVATEPEKALMIKEELEALEKYIAESIGRGGRAKSAKNDVETVRKRVSQNIDRAIKSLRTDHPPLARHLSDFVECGRTLTYTRGDIRWDVEM